MIKSYDIRYNTKSTDDTNRWRVIDFVENREILVSDVVIQCEAYTSSIYVADLDEYKFHITCKGNMEIVDNVAYITNDNVKRQILKTISYRILATTSTIFGAYYMGLPIEYSALIGVGELMIKPVLYFLHERAWYNLGFHKKEIIEKKSNY